MKLQSVGVGSMQMGFKGMVGLSGKHNAGLGLSKGNRGLVW